MSIHEELFRKLVSPGSRRPLRAAPAAGIEALNRAIEAGGVVDRQGRPVTAGLDGGLIPEGEPLIYPIRDGIPILLPSDAIPFGAPWGERMSG